jgi:hypothetical protein
MKGKYRMVKSDKLMKNETTTLKIERKAFKEAVKKVAKKGKKANRKIDRSDVEPPSFST